VLLGNGSDDEDDASSSDPRSHIERVNAQLREAANKQKVEAQQIKAVMEDETVYEYDSILDELKAQREQQKQAAEEARKEESQSGSKYLTALKEAAELRKRERQLFVEKHRLQALDKEEAVFGEKERFVTSAYKKKLEEDKAWDQKLREQDEKDAEGLRQGIDKLRYSAMLEATGLKPTPSASAAVATAAAVASTTSAAKPSAAQGGLAMPNPAADATMPAEAGATTKESDGENGDNTPKPLSKEEERARKIEAARERYFARKALREKAGRWP